MTFSGSNPRRTLYKSQKLRNSRPAAISSTSESANSVTTKALSVNVWPFDPFEPRPSCLSTWIGSILAASKAGASPKQAPARTETPSAKSNTVQLIEISLSRGKVAGIICSRSFLAKKRIARPAIPPSVKAAGSR